MIKDVNVIGFFLERIQNERQQALEKMGISIQASGIQVEKNKYYLVNLNADPSLNELLVYYLKVRTHLKYFCHKRHREKTYHGRVKLDVIFNF